MVPLDFFAFPLNVLLTALALAGVVWSWRKHRNSVFVRFMLSPKATFLAIFLLLAFALFIGLTGMRELVRSWLFLVVMIYFMTVLAYVILRGYGRWRFMLLHAGLLIALVSGYVGAPDRSEVTLKVFADNDVYERSDIRLLDFQLDTYDNGSPSEYRAFMEIDGREVTLKVNHPYSRRFGEDIYLTGYDVVAGADSDYCVIQIVKDPWRYGVVSGIVMMILGAVLLFIDGPRRSGRK